MGLISGKRADRRFPKPAVYNNGCTLTIASLIGRTKEDSVLRDEFLKDLLVACTVLQSEDQGIFPNQLCILLEGPACDIGLCEEDDEIDRAFCCAARKGAHAVCLRLSVPLDRDVIVVDRTDAFSVASYKNDFSVQREFSSEEKAHRAGSDNSSFH